jgi:hypothetical protein
MKYKVKVKCPNFPNEFYYSDEEGHLIGANQSWCNPSFFPDIFEPVNTEPIFITCDGVKFYNISDIVYPVLLKSYNLVVPIEIGDVHFICKGETKHYNYFSSKESALEWIELNKPKFSIKQIKNALYKAEFFDDKSTCCKEKINIILGI